MINKPTVIITSLGRTGTLFFKELFDSSVSDCTCLHEPDRLNFGQFKGIRDRTTQVLHQINESGPLNILYRKFLLSDWSIESISKERLTGKSNDVEAKKRIVSQRRKFIQSQPGTLYIESSSAFYGVIDLLSEVFNEHRVIYIIRDGRDWVRSKMNFGTIYNKNKLQQMISGTWPTAVDLNDGIYSEKWHKMSRFEKICWAWSALNQYALACVAKNPCARVFRFEDLMNLPEGDKNLSDLLGFATNLNIPVNFAPNNLSDMLRQKTHTSTKVFPDWSKWNRSQVDCFVRICGPLMKKMGYEINA